MEIEVPHPPACDLLLGWDDRDLLLTETSLGRTLLCGHLNHLISPFSGRATSTKIKGRLDF